MIWNSLLSVVFGIFNFVISLFPDVNSEVITYISSSTTDFKEILASANFLFPVSSALSMLSFIFVVEAGLFTFKIIKYVASNLSLGFIKH